MNGAGGNLASAHLLALIQKRYYVPPPALQPLCKQLYQHPTPPKNKRLLLFIVYDHLADDLTEIDQHNALRDS